MLNFSKTLLAALLIAIAAGLVVQPGFGASITDHQLVIIENSSTSLSVTYDGTPVPVTLSPGPDNWLLNPLPVNLSPSAFSLLWFEPGTSTLFNHLAEIPASGQFFVSSDTPIFGTFSAQSNGFTYVNAGLDNSDGVGVDITFRDHGDIAATPDTGTTGSLFALSLIGLAFLRRKMTC
jgi:hypothetical protein